MTETKSIARWSPFVVAGLVAAMCVGIGVWLIATGQEPPFGGLFILWAALAISSQVKLRDVERRRASGPGPEIERLARLHRAFRVDAWLFAAYGLGFLAVALWSRATNGEWFVQAFGFLMAGMFAVGVVMFALGRIFTARMQRRMQ